MAEIDKHGNESIWDSAAAGWAKWEFALMEALTDATEQMLDAANIVFAVSNFSKNRLCDRFEIEPGKVVVIGNGVEQGFFRVG